MAILGYLGLGIMGYPMARNLRRAGHELWVWSHTAEKAARLAREEGAHACSSPRQVAEHADCIFVCVGDTAMSEQVILGDDGLVHSLKPGAVVADISTISVAASLRMGRRLAEAGSVLLDAPCTGSKLGAENGKLTFMVGGDRQAFERVRPCFDPMGQQVFYCGGPGMGLRVKIVQNLIQSNILEAFSEGMVLAVKAGIDPELMLEVLNNTAARSGLIQFKAPYVLRRDFSTHFSVKWMHKDLRLALELADECRVPVPITAITSQIYQAAIARGFSEDDFSSIIRVLEEIAGVEVKKNQGQ